MQLRRKNKKNRILAGIITVCWVLCLMTPIHADTDLPFDDVPEDEWFYDGVRYVSEHGIMTGTCDLTFSPDLNTTRGMIVTILYKIESRPEVDGPQFSDVKPSRYYASPILWAKKHGIVSGYPDGTFRPEQDISRQQLATILFQYANYKELNTSNVGDLSSYADTSAISRYAMEPLQWMVGNGLLSGMPGKKITPGGKATRAQLAVILMQFCKRYSIEVIPSDDFPEENDDYTFISREGRMNGVPGNSMIGAEESLKAGYRSIRVSLQRTKDGVWVLLHDDRINSLAFNPDGSAIQEDVLISEHSYDELLTYDYGLLYGKQYAGTKLTRAEELLAFAKEQQMEVLLETKKTLDASEVLELAELIRDQELQDDIWVSSSDLSTLEAVSNELPYAHLAYIDHLTEESLQTLLTSGLASEDHRLRLDCYYTDDFDEELLEEFAENEIDLKVGSVYTVDQLHKFIDLKIRYIEVTNIANPWSYVT